MKAPPAHTRASVLCAVIAGAVVSCVGPPADDGGSARAYLLRPASARAALVASLVNPSNGYSQLRLARYATGDGADWDRLPEWNPTAEPIAASELDAPGGVSTDTLGDGARSLALIDSVTSIDGPDDPTLVALGREAFFRYPMQIVPALRVGVASRAAAARYGLWVDDVSGVGGLARTRVADGSTMLAMTCATCHARPNAAAALTPGLPNAALDLGAAILASEGLPPSASDDPRAAWGPGRVDVTTADGREPARIPDLRPVRWLSYLQQDATVDARDPIALAIRIETLIVTSSQSTVRPPRIVALALAAYVRSFASTPPPADEAAAASPRGAELFASGCAGCHAPPGLTGPPVSLATVGTDATLGLSADRGTGSYRVPSLRGVSTRGPLLHDGTLPSIDALLDPGRLGDGFDGRLHGTGPVPGHSFGLDLGDADRAALLSYLAAL